MRPHRSWRFAIAIFALVAAAACSSEEADGPAVSLERDISPIPLELEWRRGGAEEDSVLYDPWVVRAVPGQAVVLDHGGHRVRSFDIETGTLLWSAGRRGSGPLEFEDPRDLFYDSGNWGVWDARTGRLTHISQQGQLASERIITSQLPPNRFCPLGDGRLGVLWNSPEAALGVLAPDDRVSELAHLPWSYLARDAPLQRQAKWATDGSGSCVAVLLTASGFVSFGEDGLGRGHPYAEAIEPPRAWASGSGGSEAFGIEDITVATRDAFLHGPELWLLFQGKTEDAGRLIDVHDIETGDYLHSYKLPFWGATSIARLGELLFVTRTLDAYPVLEAYRILSDHDPPALPTR